MKTLPFAAAVVAAVSLTASAPAPAQTACGARADVLAYLGEHYRERLVALGLADAGVVIELLVADGGASWTILATSSAGLTCVLAAGETWQPVPASGQGRES